MPGKEGPQPGMVLRHPRLGPDYRQYRTSQPVLPGKVWWSGDCRSVASHLGKPNLVIGFNVQSC